MKNSRSFVIGVLVGIAAMGTFFGGALAERFWGLPVVDNILSKINTTSASTGLVESRRVVQEESVVTDVVEKTAPSVVTVSISKTRTLRDPTDFFGGFGGLFGGPQSPKTNQQQKIEQDIGTGFVISSDGLIVTNKHVVSDTDAKYKVVLVKSGKEEVVDVQNIYRDPVTDLAILKVNRNDLTPLPLGDSSSLKAGQLVIAIGTALGEFRSTVTTGVISGLGRGITAGSPFEGAEKLDNVIQTDAAINPGNSGGPLLNSAGQVIGVNVAVSQEGQNIGFALPINLVKDSISTFKSTGQFERPMLGVSYRFISRQTALLNDVPQGAYVESIVEDSPASKAGLEVGDIITELDGQKLTDEGATSLAQIINKKKLGDSVKLKVWRDGKDMEITARLDKMR